MDYLLKTRGVGAALVVLAGPITSLPLCIGTAGANELPLGRDGGSETVGGHEGLLPVAESGTNWTLLVGGASFLLLIAFLFAAGSVMQRRDLAPIGWPAVLGSLMPSPGRKAGVDQGAVRRRVHVAVPAGDQPAAGLSGPPDPPGPAS